MPHTAALAVDEWASACSDAFVPLGVRSAGGGFAARLDQRRLTPQVSVTTVWSEGSQVYRDAAVIAEHPRDAVLVSLHRSGTGSVSQHGRRASLRPGTAALYDASSPYVLDFPGRMSEVVLQLPRRVLGRHVAERVSARPLPDGGPLTALTCLASALPAASPGPRDDGDLAEALTSLLRSVVGSDPASAPRVEAEMLLRALRAFVDEHVAEPDLCPERLAAAHFVSLRLVQKLFAEDGDSPAAYIRRRRLELARELLRGGTRVGVAAERSGFVDPDSFSRAFRREFGLLPSEFLA